MAAMDVLGGSVAWHCQYDPDDMHQYAARILEHHWPGIPNHGDITAIDWTTVEPVDVLTAGFPCQDLSYAGRGAGIKEGTRSGLWYTVADAIRALRPGLVVLENVRAIVNRRPGLDVVLASLAELGFDAEWICVRACDVGAPHPRDRWFCLAWPAEDADRAALGERRFAAPGQEEGRRARADAGRRDRTPSADANGEHERGVTERDRRGEPEAPARNGCGTPADTEVLRHWDTRSAGVGGIPAAAIPGDSSGDIDWDRFGPAIRRWEYALGRPAPRPTQPGRTGDRLSPAFVEFLMGLPAGWVTDVPGLARNAQMKALGNGVVPQQAAHALRLLLDRVSQEAAA
jgi:DNA (cytosine-5)-methyltransferase 1